MPTQRKKIAVIGDCMWDHWHHGKLLPSQDGVQKFVDCYSLVTPGGAANAARQLAHWDIDVYLIGRWLDYQKEWEFNRELAFTGYGIEHKHRYLDETNRIIFRHDVPTTRKFDDEEATLTIKAVRTMKFDGVLISDYDKGFLDYETIQSIIEECNKQDIPVVCDAKRPPAFYDGAIYKFNEAYANQFKDYSWLDAGKTVITCGANTPIISAIGEPSWIPPLKPVPCLNHVGAGDCFAAHLLIFLIANQDLQHAVRLAHSAGRIFVQHPHSRPPWPHEVNKDVYGHKNCNPVRLRQSLEGKKIIFTNGVFRIPHAGHAWLMQWAKSQGDILIVGINDDPSATALRPGEFVLPLQERIEMLSAMECVDWIIPFSEPDPCEVIKQLKPEFLVKGSEYSGQRVPGDDFVKVLFAPESPYPAHSTDIVAAMRV